MPGDHRLDLEQQVGAGEDASCERDNRPQPRFGVYCGLCGTASGLPILAILFRFAASHSNLAMSGLKFGDDVLQIKIPGF